MVLYVIMYPETWVTKQLLPDCRQFEECPFRWKKLFLYFLNFIFIIAAQQGFEPSQRVLSTTVNIGYKYSLGEERMTSSQSSYPLSPEKSGKTK